MKSMAPSVAAGLVLGLPGGWLLSYLGTLPFFLGLFFFALVGLLIGAVMFRVGSARMPFARSGLRLATGIVVLVTWTVSTTLEARAFPRDQARAALAKLAAIPEGATRGQVVQKNVEFLTRYLAREHRPGGVLGYVRWELSGTRIELPLAGTARTAPITPEHWRWGLRVLLSVVLLTFGVHSQVLSLAAPAAGRGGSSPAERVAASSWA